jgi:hypothetical protein
MIDVEDKSPNHTLPDAESQQEDCQKMWEGGDIKNKSDDSVV